MAELPMADDGGKCCERCKFWYCDHGPSKEFPALSDIEQFNRVPIGECRRLPPVLWLHKNGDTQRAFPETWTDDWCGEWAAAAANEAAPA